MKLFSRYKNASRLFVGVISIIFVRIVVFLFPVLVPDGDISQVPTQNIVIAVLVLGTFFTGTFGLLMSIYENWAWRWHSRHYDFNGYWKMKITYEYLERGFPRREKLNLPHSFESVFIISQTINDLSFTEGFSAPNEVWRDKSLRLTENGFNMSYRVRRSDKKISDPLPEKMIGYEEVEVTERDRLGRPVFMTGSLHHAAIPLAALYRGTTTYAKIDRKEYHTLLTKMRTGKYATSYEEKSDE